MKKTFYEKVGRRYKPVVEYDAVLLDALPAGSHLITVHPGGSSRRYRIDPAFAPLIAAGVYARPAIENALHKASEGRPERKLITPEQLAAWQKLAEAFGDELATIRYPSIHDIAQAGVDEMQRQAEDLLKNTAVRKAYDQFLLVAKLAIESK
jgi:hypothetical protein